MSRHDDDENERRRVYHAISGAILQFHAERRGQTFHVEELRRYVRQFVSNIAPDSPGRILRQLRIDCSLDYVVINRRQSLYQFRSIPTPRGQPMSSQSMFAVSQSKVSQWRRCKLAYHFQHREYLKPKVRARPLYFGSTVHTMLEALAEGKDARTALAEIAHRDEKLFREERDYFVKLIEDISFIFRAYRKYWSNDPLVFHSIGNRRAEVPFTVKIDDAIEVKGTIDGIVVHKSFNWLLENKTHAEFPNADHRWRNLQGAVYNSISRLLGWPKLQGLCWNYVRSKEPTRPKLLKSGKISIAKDCDTLPEVVLDVLEEHSLNPHDYQEFIAAQEANLPTWFERVWQPVQEGVVKILWREFLATAREMSDYYARTAAPPPRTVDIHCKWCPFEKLCRAELQGLDVDDVKQREYVFDDTPYQRGVAA